MMSAPFLAKPDHSAMARSTADRPAPEATPRHVLRFESLFVAGRGYSFPCDALGQVSLNRLSDRARDNYLFARACVGREFAQPCVQAELH